ncbi:MAG: photosynthetic complex putative assembly protein PuhB [Pseudomonadota bacterium]
MTLQVARKPKDLADFHDQEACRQTGLPEQLPEGEEILWQGRPEAWALARHSLFTHWILGYTALLAFWRAGTLIDLMPVWAALSATVPIILTGLAAVAILWLLAAAQARATVYTITNKRVVMQIGAALSLNLNLPFSRIDSADLDLRRNGIGTIALQMEGRTRLSYLVCWPHVRPWKWNPAQPALRCIPDAENVARLLATAVQTRTPAADPRLDPAAAIAAE